MKIYWAVISRISTAALELANQKRNPRRDCKLCGAWYVGKTGISIPFGLDSLES
jgi:hypothetical protein